VSISNFLITPNPSVGNLTISFETQKTEQVQIKCFDMTGQLLLQETTATTIGAFSKEINLGKVARGIYSLQLSTSEKILNKRIEIQ
jgi:hypothetical protein